MNLYEQYIYECEKYNKIDRNNYDEEIFVICNNGKVYKGGFYNVLVSKDKITFIPPKGEVIYIHSIDVDHITYNLYKINEVDNK